MDHSVEYERIFRVYETTYGESDESRRAQILSDLAAQLSSLTSAEPKNSEAFHLLGLCWYELPNVTAETQRQAEDAFRCCLAIDPEHQYANLFLGHVLFDTKRYEEADERFARIDSNFFAAQTQQWRIVKNEELRLCCRLETETAEVAFHEIDALCERYERDPEVEYIVPREIILCLDDLATRKALPQEALRTYASRVLTMLELTDNLGIAYLQEAITRLRRIATA